MGFTASIDFGDRLYLFEAFGEERVAELLRARHATPMQALAEELLDSARDWAAGTPQADDVTILLLRRLPG